MKKYLKLEDKINLVDDIVEGCVSDYELDVLQREVATVLFTTIYFDKKYYNENVVKDQDGNMITMETYDKLMKKRGYFNNIYQKIPKYEIHLIEQLIDDSIKEELRRGGAIQSIVSKVESLDFEKIAKEFKDLDPKKLKEIKNIVNINNGSVKLKKK